jgi:hypothetical protein
MSQQYVILEFNQASRQPRLAFDDVYDNYADAMQDADALLADNRGYGRREHYAVASIDIEWDSRDED